jgi:hypothetical protein
MLLCIERRNLFHNCCGWFLLLHQWCNQSCQHWWHELQSRCISFLMVSPSSTLSNQAFIEVLKWKHVKVLIFQLHLLSTIPA